MIKSRLRFFKLSILFWGCVFSSLLMAQDVSDYSLGPGDVIKVQVFGEDDMTVETRLNNTGTLSYPLLGEIKVLGSTVGGLERSITRRLKGPYFVDPKVNVSIVEYRNFYVNGAVKSPGGYPYQPGLTVRKAVSIAGGFTDRASYTKLDVIREADQLKRTVRLRLGDELNPGDILTVQESFF